MSSEREEERVRLLHEPAADEGGEVEPKGHQTCDVVVVGTGLAESLTAASLARRGVKVLHLEPGETYGGLTWATRKLKDVLRDLQTIQVTEGEGVAEQETASDAKARFSFRRSGSVSGVLPEVSDRVGKVDGNKVSLAGDLAADIESIQFDLMCAPKLCLGAGDLIEALVASDAHRYLEFKAVQSTSMWASGGEEADSEPRSFVVPASRSDIFKSKDLTPVEKRLLMRYLKSEQDAIAAEESSGPGPAPPAAAAGDATMEEYLRDTHKLPEKLRLIVMHGIADLDDLAGKAPSAAEGRERLVKYAKSINRFGPGVGALLACNYGGGELTQAFCRLAAVHGATYVLKYPPRRVEVIEGDEGGHRYEVGIPGAAPIRCKAVVVGPEARLCCASSQAEPNEAGRIFRCACVAIQDSPAKGGSIRLHVFPPNTVAGNSCTIRALCVEGNALNTCANENLVVIYLSCRAAPGCGDPKAQLVGALSRLACLKDLDGSPGLDLPDLPMALLCLYYTQEAPEPAVIGGESRIVHLGGPDASLGFRDTVRAATGCVSQLYPEHGNLFAEAEGKDEALEDSEDEAETSYLERVLQSVSQTKTDGDDLEG